MSDVIIVQPKVHVYNSYQVLDFGVPNTGNPQFSPAAPETSTMRRLSLEFSSLFEYTKSVQIILVTGNEEQIK
jgi:hypothetical protein